MLCCFFRLKYLYETLWTTVQSHISAVHKIQNNVYWDTIVFVGVLSKAATVQSINRKFICNCLHQKSVLFFFFSFFSYYNKLNIWIHLMHCSDKH